MRAQYPVRLTEEEFKHFELSSGEGHEAATDFDAVLVREHNELAKFRGTDGPWRLCHGGPFAGTWSQLPMPNVATSLLKIL